MKGLAEIVSEAFGLPPLAFGDIEDVLGYVFKRSTDEKVVLVLDEYPYLRATVPGMDSIVQALLDTDRDTSRLSFVLCGSYVEVMKSLLEKDNPLYGRLDVKINLRPMDYYEAALFYPEYSAADKVRLYSVFGGIPYYNRLIDQGATVRGNLMWLIVEPDARLEDEVSSYLLTEVSKIANANEVFCAFAEGYASYSDILAQSHVSSGGFTAQPDERMVFIDLEDLYR